MWGRVPFSCAPASVTRLFWNASWCRPGRPAGVGLEYKSGDFNYGMKADTRVAGPWKDTNKKG